ncbi:dihydrolipoyl dehydrogenase family protein [Actinoplanes regularis]|uniref:Pyruvate/2-oxoglutarate dehydrogenase complex, dihydrolipoamide dehydrogenase (E3) component n=1 Tax=Actinoplanes regularis TaxID=52697 RepID=A0A239H9J3_9ACTN|nr:NAD(P)/FAD-dependent oxidoreductase [Actinoplanes regularis]GIE92106.1 pyridine nucleotide-disulfide oxidoreductase [Actinoplanes regularis]SNS77932.1 Pyruvate/2-oxoglutarate dehydrogenase complex, dihydrolipoamide dehydrogenase (E3) component [Actinoplanes regularis]
MAEARQVDVVVVGLGVGGEEAAGRLAAAGLNVVGVEHRLVGGECPYWGCIPTKIMVRAGNALAEARRIPGLAGTSTVEADWAPVAKRIRDEATDDWNDKVAVDRFTAKGGTFVRGTATITGPGRVRVGDEEYTARRGLVIATGTAAVIPPVEGLAGTPYWTNREAVEAATLPESMLVLGGGAIGCELAQAYARFGVRVTVIEGSPRLLAMEEPESSAVAEAALAADGVLVRTGARARSVAHDGEFQVTLTDGTVLTGEKLLVATGRAARLSGLGLENVGLDPAARFLSTDERMRAGDGVWAVGDVTGNGAFTHMAMYEADIAVRDLLGQGGPGADYRARPRVTFLDPEIGAVGLTEQQAREAGLNVQVGYVPLNQTSRGFIHGPGNEGFLKLVADHDRGVLVGGTTAGQSGGEMIAAVSVAVHAEVPVSTLLSQIWAYPTFHRGLGDALKALA